MILPRDPRSSRGRTESAMDTDKPELRAQEEIPLGIPPGSIVSRFRPGLDVRQQRRGS